MIALLLIAMLAATSGQAPQVDPAAQLAVARELYVSAAYEDALNSLRRIPPDGPLADQVDTYRALCLLALGRSDEAARVMEQIVVRNPGFTIDDAQVSPRLVAVFRDVQARVLPLSARAVYASARENFDRGRYDIASRQLREVLRLIDPARVPPSMAGVADLRVLAEGFMKLSDSMAVTAPTAESIAAATDPVATAGRSGVAIYTSMDRDVVMPVEIRRQVPLWEPPAGTSQGTYQGLVEVIINEQGRIEAAAIRRSVAPAYDAALLASTTEWRFQPATRNGIPVKFRRSYEVIVHSR